ncbi:conjugative transposon protein TraJ [Algoriphagus sp.]|uniref:conjugative transposon protein TraJ n=1 Tax=Algoriphagus sp. TaxID=1872435 RepID=UPI00261E7723|nr:conjugative transposon protein TraJ [Algoriphagus sp.]
MAKHAIRLMVLLGTLLFPRLLLANDLALYLDDFNEVIASVSQTIGNDTYVLQYAAKSIAGIGAIFYIGNRVWKHIAEAEAVDFYPLFRPFVLGILVVNFSWVTGAIELIMTPVLLATEKLRNSSQEGINQLIEAKKKAMKEGQFWNMYVGNSGNGDRDLWYEYSNPEAGEEGWMESIGNGIQFAMEKASFHMQLNIKTWMSEVLQVLYQATGLGINVIRLFYLVVLGILGPISFGLAVFEGFQHTLIQWIARYINVFLWLPVTNIFSFIINEVQQRMLEIDLDQIESGGRTFFSSTDTAFLIFMVVAILGYTTVPSVSNYIIYAGGRDSLLRKSSQVISQYPRQFQKMLR